MFDDFDTLRGRWQRLGEQVLQAKQKHEQKTGQFHDCSQHFRREQTGKPRESHGAIDDLHYYRTQANPEAPPESLSGAFVHDGEVDWPDGNGNEEAAQGAHEPRE